MRPAHRVVSPQRCVYRLVGLPLVAELDLCECEVEERLAVVGVQLAGAAEGHSRFLKASGGEVCATQVVMSRSELRVGADGLLILLDRLVLLTLREQLEPALVVLERLLLRRCNGAHHPALPGVCCVRRER